MNWKQSEYAGWGRVLRASGELARPERQAGLNRLMADTPAPAIGMRRSYGDACLNTDGRAIDLTRLDRFLDFDAETGVLRCEAGLTLGEITRVLAPRGWLPAVLPGTGFATVGGAIANDVHGKNHHNAGSFCQHVRSVTLIGADGTRRVVTPDYPLFTATAGGLGQTGVIAEAELQLKRARGDIVTVTERRAEGLDEFLSLLDRSEATYVVGWIDATATGPSLGRGILEEAETGAGLIPPRKPSKSVPFNAPGFALSPLVVRNFNRIYYGRVPKRGRSVVKPIEDFFFPLDRIHDWNRLYGKAGFHQFQCVVPLDQAQAIREMLDRVAGSGLASPLAVLKRLGPGRAGHMSFPMEGYTLAVDFPNRAGAEAIVRSLHDVTAKAEGRVYLAKDALLGPDEVRSMYPEYGEWLENITAADPEAVFATDLVRRLKLREAVK